MRWGSFDYFDRPQSAAMKSRFALARTGDDDFSFAHAASASTGLDRGFAPLPEFVRAAALSAPASSPLAEAAAAPTGGNAVATRVPGEVYRLETAITADAMPDAQPAASATTTAIVGPAIVPATTLSPTTPTADLGLAAPAVADTLFAEPVTTPLTLPVPHAFLDAAQHVLSGGPAIMMIVPVFEPLPPPPVIG